MSRGYGVEEVGTADKADNVAHLAPSREGSREVDWQGNIDWLD